MDDSKNESVGGFTSDLPKDLKFIKFGQPANGYWKFTYLSGFEIFGYGMLDDAKRFVALNNGIGVDVGFEFIGDAQDNPEIKRKCVFNIKDKLAYFQRKIIADIFEGGADE